MTKDKSKSLIAQTDTDNPQLRDFERSDVANESRPLPPVSPEHLLAEAEWVTKEMTDTQNLLHKYRNIYVTALAAASVWILGKLFDALSKDVGTPFNIRTIQEHPAIAVAVAALTLVNVVFTLLTLESNAHLHNLAKYRDILGLKLGDGVQPWRWELWRRSNQGSTFIWPSTVNTAFFLVVGGATVGALWFIEPATDKSRTANCVWWIATLATAAVVVIAAANAKKYRDQHREYGDGLDSNMWDNLQRPAQLHSAAKPGAG
jgi:hypothetical protein